MKCGAIAAATGRRFELNRQRHAAFQVRCTARHGHRVRAARDGGYAIGGRRAALGDSALVAKGIAVGAAAIDVRFGAVFDAVRAMVADAAAAGADGAIAVDRASLPAAAGFAERIARGAAAIDTGLGAVLDSIGTRNAFAAAAIAVHAVGAHRAPLLVRALLAERRRANAAAIDVRFVSVLGVVGARNALGVLAHAAGAIGVRRAPFEIGAREFVGARGACSAAIDVGFIGVLGAAKTVVAQAVMAA